MQMAEEMSRTASIMAGIGLVVAFFVSLFFGLIILALAGIIKVLSILRKIYWKNRSE